MTIDRIYIGRFMLQQATEPFDDTSDYRECLLLERDVNDLCSYYINLHKDSRFSEVDFRFPPDEKLLLEEDYKIKMSEYRSYEHRKDQSQPLWKLHVSTIKKIIARLHELADAQAN